jgi:hypothetical protein
MSGLTVRTFYRLDPTGLVETDTALIRLANGEPWLIRGATSQGSAYLLLASPLVPAASDLPVSAAMVPFVDAVVGDWGRRGEYSPEGVEGVARVRLPARAQTLERGGGSAERVEPGSWFHPRAAGNYRVTDGETVVLAFSVNPPVAEADLSRGRREDLRSTLPGADWTWVDRGDPLSWKQHLFRARHGRVVWRPIVALLFLFAIVESGLAASRRRRERARDHERFSVRQETS